MTKLREDKDGYTQATSAMAPVPLAKRASHALSTLAETVVRALW